MHFGRMNPAKVHRRGRDQSNTEGGDPQTQEIGRIVTVDHDNVCYKGSDGNCPSTQSAEVTCRVSRVRRTRGPTRSCCPWSLILESYYSPCRHLPTLFPNNSACIQYFKLQYSAQVHMEALSYSKLPRPFYP